MCSLTPHLPQHCWPLHTHSFPYRCINACRLTNIEAYVLTFMERSPWRELARIRKKKKEKLASDVTLLWSVGVVPKPRQTPSDSTLGWSDGRPGLRDLDQGRKHTAWFSHQSLLLLETYSRREAGSSLCPALSQGSCKTGWVCQMYWGFSSVGDKGTFTSQHLWQNYSWQLHPRGSAATSTPNSYSCWTHRDVREKNADRSFGGHAGVASYCVFKVNAVLVLTWDVGYKISCWYQTDGEFAWHFARHCSQHL